MSFSFNGLHATSFPDLFIRTINNPLLPPRNSSRLSVPGRPGELVFQNLPRNKLLSFRFTLAQHDPLARRLTARQIAAWLSAPGKLVLDYEPDKFYSVIRAAANIALSIQNDADSFDVEFECEPFQYGREVSLSGSGFAENNGSAPAPTIFSVSGSGSVSVSSDLASFSLDSIPSATAIIDSKRMLVYSPSAPAQNLTRLFSGSFINIPPGGTHISVSGTPSVTLSYRESWL